MRPFAIALVSLATAASAFGFNPNARGSRIAVLDSAARYSSGTIHRK